MKKANQKIYYDKKTDVLWLNLKSGAEEEYKEVAPGINLELDKKGELLGIEILNASKVLGTKPKINQKSFNQFASVPHRIK